MLVLSRKKDESIEIDIGGRLVRITIVRIEDKKVRVGIDADKEVTVLRSELVSRNRPIATETD